MQKDARVSWQTYKARCHLVLCLTHFHSSVQLLEYLEKHGFGCVVDVSTLKITRSVHQIDEQGKDQGTNGNVSQILKHPPCL